MANEKDVQNTEALLALLREQGKTEEEIRELLKGRSASYEDQIAQLREQLQYATDMKEQQELSLQLAEREAALKVKNGEMSRAEYERLKESLALQSQVADEWDNIFQTFTGISAQWESSALGKLITNPQEGFAGLTNSFKRTFTLANMLGSALMKVQEATFMLTMQTDNALAEFNRSTGAANTYGQQIIDLEKDMYHYGVSIDDAASSMGALVTEVYNFNHLSKTQQTSMVSTVALLNELGVDAGLTSANIQAMTSVMGISASGAEAFSREMFALAQSIKMPPAEMAAAFQDATPYLSKFGSESTDVFKKLVVNAREANMEVSELLSIVEKFDTFEGAADSVGKLNAILGGPFLSSLEMVKATDPIERMKLLSDAANDAGKSFDEMGYYERIAVTEAMGLSDVTQLAKVMAGEFDNMADSTHMSQSELIALADQQKDFNDLMSEMQELARGFALQLYPVVKGVKSFVQGVQDLNHEMGGWLIPGLALVATGLGALITLTTAMKVASVAMTAAEAAKGLAILGTAAAQSTATPIMIFAGTAAGAAATPMYAFAGAALAVGAAFLLVGAGVGLAAAGMSLFMTSLAEIPVADMFGYGLALYAIAGGMAALSAAMLFGGAFGMASLVTSVAALGLTLKTLDKAKLHDLALLFNAIAVVMNSTAENLTAVRDTIGDVTKSIAQMEKVDMQKAVVIKELIQVASGQPVAGTTTGTAATAPMATQGPQQIVMNIDLGNVRLLTKVVEVGLNSALGGIYRVT